MRIRIQSPASNPSQIFKLCISVPQTTHLSPITRSKTMLGCRAGRVTICDNFLASQQQQRDNVI